MSTELRRVRAARIVAALSVLATAACAGTLADREAFELALEEAGVPDAGASDASPPAEGSGGQASGGCPDVPTGVLQPRCGLSGCHGDNPAAGLDLVSPDVRARLLGHPASGGPGVLIDPAGSADASVLYLKLTPSPPFGARMPLVGGMLDDATMACVAAWIAGPIAAGGDAGAE
jgi:hypothetical protein